MTDKLHCPFCSRELKELKVYREYYCSHCLFDGGETHASKEVWELAIKGKAAQDALKEAIKCINWTIDTIVNGLDREADIVGCCELTLERINEITKQDIKQ